MKKVIKLSVLLSVIALPQLLSAAYKHKVINKWKNPVNVKVNIRKTSFGLCSDVEKQVEADTSDTDNVTLSTGLCCTKSIRVEDIVTKEELGTVSFGNRTCVGSVVTINKNGSVSLKKNVF